VVDSDLSDILHQGQTQQPSYDDSLPTPRPEPSQMLDPRALRVWRIGAALGTLFIWIPAGIVVAVTYFADWIWPWVLLILIFPLLVTILQVFIMPPLEWRRWRYEVTEREIDMQRGVLVTTRTLVPMSRVQHVDTQQGPLLRYYGLSAVTITTAGGGHEIPGLSEEVASEVRDRIAALAGVADDV
jgi:uncharacterized protein